MTEEGADFTAVLKDAQAKGYAEADPTLDVEGIDAMHKLSVLLSLRARAPLTLVSVFNLTSDSAA